MIHGDLRQRRVDAMVTAIVYKNSYFVAWDIT